MLRLPIWGWSVLFLACANLAHAGQTRKYYIAAEEATWDYAPSGFNQWTGEPLNATNSTSELFVRTGNGFIGRKNLKTLFFSYPNEKFEPTERIVPPPGHGFLGPVIYAEVGDKLEVLFKNKVQNLSFSIHPHGVSYTEENEGAIYLRSPAGSTHGRELMTLPQLEPLSQSHSGSGSESTSGSLAGSDSLSQSGSGSVSQPGSDSLSQSGSLSQSQSQSGSLSQSQSGSQDQEESSTGGKVDPDHTWTYHWSVPTEAGPGPDDENCVLWAYHSHVNEVKDVYSGLVGPLVVCRPGILNSNGVPSDVQREFFAYLNVDNEGESWLLDRNLETYAQPIPSGSSSSDTYSEEFKESNLKHNINGYIYGNLNYKMCEGDKVRWHLMAMGTEIDLHTAHWHAHTVLEGKHRKDSIEILPASFRSVSMNATQPGQWAFHCHVNDHILAGMTALYRVEPTASEGCNSVSGSGPAVSVTSGQSRLQPGTLTYVAPLVIFMAKKIFRL